MNETNGQITQRNVLGIYYAFWCYPSVCAIYMATVVGFIGCGVVFRDKMNKDEHIIFRLVYFISFTLYGFVPSFHWAVMNGFDSDEVKIFLPRIIIFYLFLLLAFAFYIAKFPESVRPGKFDIYGSSHQWWHVFISLGLAYWHHTGEDWALEQHDDRYFPIAGYTFAEYRLESQCGVTGDLQQKYYDKFWVTL